MRQLLQRHWQSGQLAAGELAAVLSSTCPCLGLLARWTSSWCTAAVTVTVTVTVTATATGEDTSSSSGEGYQQPRRTAAVGEQIRTACWNLWDPGGLPSVDRRAKGWQLEAARGRPALTARVLSSEKRAAPLPDGRISDL
jgi:hypothetical protein